MINRMLWHASLPRNLLLLQTFQQNLPIQLVNADIIGINQFQRQIRSLSSWLPQQYELT